MKTYDLQTSNNVIKVWKGKTKWCPTYPLKEYEYKINKNVMKIIRSTSVIKIFMKFPEKECSSSKVHILWEGHKILRNLHRRFVLCSASQSYGGDFAKFCGLLRIYVMYQFMMLQNGRKCLFQNPSCSVLLWYKPSLL